MKDIKKKILLIEDEEMMIDVFSLAFEDYPGIEISVARTLTEAENFLPGLEKFDLVIMDGNLGGESSDIAETQPLLGKMRAGGFTKPIWASSNLHNDAMVKAGATLGANKETIWKKALNYFGLC